MNRSNGDSAPIYPDRFFRPTPVGSLLGRVAVVATFILVALLVGRAPVQAQPFERLGLQGVEGGSSTWGDYDADGDLDLVVTGFAAEPSATIYENDGTGSLTPLDAGLNGVFQSASDWGDYDGDGDLDLIVTGYAATGASAPPATLLYRNDGGGAFTEISDAESIRLVDLGGQGSVDWGDYDGDQDLDLVLTGRDENGDRQALIYRNDGNDTFFDIAAGLDGADFSSSDWGDIDNDGDLDLAVCGDGADAFNSQFAKVYRNEGTDTFVEAQELLGVYGCTNTWGDYDNDGHLDLLLTGQDRSNALRTEIYRNDSTGTLSAVPSRLGLLKGVGFGESAWVDYNGDGTLDIILTGDDQARDGAAVIYRNSGGATFEDITFTDIGANISDLANSSVDWGDFDGDGDLDLIATGEDIDDNSTTTIYRNEGSGVFTDAGTGLLGLVEGSSDWGDYDGDGRLDLLLTGLDGAGDPVSIVYRRSETGGFTAAGAGVPGTAGGTGIWGDSDADGDLDLFLSGRDASRQPVAEIYLNDGDGAFLDADAGLAPVSEGAADWGDLDADGDLDLIVTGRNSSDVPTATIYRNEGAAGFNPTPARLPGVGNSSSAWGDFDADGDLDLVVTGRASGDALTTAVLRPDSADSHVPIDAGLDGVEAGSSTWGDYDRDGDLDLLVTGASSSGPSATLYRNEGGEVLSPVSASLAGVENSSSAWGDMDGDGDLDLVVTGTRGGAGTTTLYRNDGGETFSVIDAALPGVVSGSGQWVDVDNDGILDLVVTGQGDTGGITAVYLNRRDPVEETASVTVSGAGAVSFPEIGIALHFSVGTGTGNITVARLDAPPTNVSGLPEGDNVSPYRVFVLADGGFAVGAGTEVRFDVDAFAGIVDAEGITVYSRPGIGRGSYTALPTSVETTGSATELVATTDGFSEFVFASPSNPLPVALADVVAEVISGGVALTWTTARETNNAGFQVERAVSVDGAPPRFVPVAFVEGAGTTTAPRRYTFVDEQVPFTAERLQYRLRQVDTDGTASVSDPVRVTLGPPAALRLHALFPNPARTRATLRYELPAATPVRVEIYDLLGRRVETFEAGHRSAGRVEQVVDVERLASGMYFLRLVAGETVQVQRFAVVR